MKTSLKHTHSNDVTQHSDDDDDDHKQPSEKSVGTTSSSILQSVTLQSSHHQPSNNIDPQNEEGEEDLQQPVNNEKIRIASSSINSNNYREQQQEEGGSGHDDQSEERDGMKVQQEKRPDDASSIHSLTKDNHNDNEGGDVTTASTCTITHDTNTTDGVDGGGCNLDDTKTTTTAITNSSSSTSPVLSAIINSVPNTTTTSNNVMMMMRNNNNNNNNNLEEEDEEDSNNSHCDEYDEYDWSPPRHIYALREIIVEEVKDEEEGGNALFDDDDVVDTPRSESPPDDVITPPTKKAMLSSATTTTRRRTRLISSQMVNISGQENVKLGKISKGAVLCSTQWKSSSSSSEEEKENGEQHTIIDTKGEGQLNIVENASFNHRTASSPPEEEEEEEEVTVCTTVNKDNNVKEEYITVVPYPIARRRMGCNCQKKVEDHQDEGTTSNNTTKRKPSLFKGVETICRIVQDTLFCQLKRREHHPNSNSNNNNVERDKVVEGYCNECNFFGENPTPKQTKKENWLKRRRRRRKSRKSLSFRNVGATVYGDEAVIGNTSEPINEILSIDSSLGIYVCESGLTAVKCQEIIDAAESLAQHKGAWSAYTYAKQTLGCKEYDGLAEASEEPVMTACATIRDRLEHVWAATTASSNSSNSSGSGYDDSGEKKKHDDALRAQAVDKQQAREGNVVEEPMTTKPKKELVLDTREPHVVKYDVSRMERRKLDMHTDRSVWTFIIALSEGRGQDYAGGGTFFEQLNATVHLQRGQMIIFRGKLRHRGVKILYGRRYLLVGFLVEQKSGSDLKGPSR